LFDIEALLVCKYALTRAKEHVVQYKGHMRARKADVHEFTMNTVLYIRVTIRWTDEQDANDEGRRGATATRKT
jgi:hypothetical protein